LKRAQHPLTNVFLNRLQSGDDAGQEARWIVVVFIL
jgi:hypothetical protein